ncbi:DNA-protecting protein DprA [Sporosarcina sp. BI001-red]|uniref:DNA-processing protein DprA n=1 Tax=Sporosarcina sp. BI001-red TaxID=2282866 RepID=UPI000E247E0E|nr:DNA-processing protein DprA [Sporosarcina sp. BI001-red]REB09742.1 DNA-protecting protein DprA [Sporosarcina sp. BI001-red]
MKLSARDHELLKLHYAWPVPYNQLARLLGNNNGHKYLQNLSQKQRTNLKMKLAQLSPIPLLDLLLEKGIIPIPFTHPDYPDQLKQLIDPPAVLYTKGDPSLLKKPNKVAIIGSRKAGDYSINAMDMVVPPLVQHGCVIVSGLAKGADTMAHQAAIRFGGQTIAVLGHGFLHLYPKENAELAAIMAKEHLLITEYPPYHPPAKWTFPMRNRIISGLSNTIVITESAVKSGTMSTIEHALDHGKEIFAVPGPIDSPLSLGPNKLLDEGARPIWNGYQIIESLVES